jgi:hypothetical protein
MTELALRWKQCTEAGRHPDAQDLLEEIILGCTSMFERLAQHEGFTRTVELPTLVQSAREKVVRWLIAWDKKRSLFSWLSVCAKNCFLSEVNKTNSYRRRYHVTSDTLEKFYGTEDHAAHRHEAAAEVRAQLREIAVRWGAPYEAAAVRLAVECLVDDHEQDRDAAVRTVCYAYGLSPELGRFFYGWGLFALRNAMYDRIYIPFTREDLLRHKFSYTHLPDLLDMVSWEQFQRIVATLGGQRLRIPTMAQLARLHESYLLTRRIEQRGGDPAVVDEVAKDFGRAPKTAQEVYEETMQDLNPDRSGEYPLYDEEA